MIYTSVRPVEIRITCVNKKPQVSNLIGRGILKITKGCKISSSFFTLTPARELGSLNYNASPKLGDLFYQNVHAWNTSYLNFSVALKPIPKITQSVRPIPLPLSELPMEFLSILALLLILFCVISCCCLMICKRNHRNRTLETYL